MPTPPTSSSRPQALPETRPLRVGCLVGTDDDRAVEFDPDSRVLVHGNNDANDLLELLRPDRVEWRRLHVTPSYYRKTRRWDVSKLDVLWNMVSDPDTNPLVLKAIDRLVAESGLPVVDPPAQVRASRRHMIADRLAGVQGVVAPKVLVLRHPTLDRVLLQTRRAGFEFPAILRLAGSQNQRHVGIFERAEDMADIFGDRRNEYYLTEFVETCGQDGFYRKHRLWFIGDQVIRKGLQFNDTWCVGGAETHAFMASHPKVMAEAVREGTEGFESLPQATRAALRDIGRRVGLDYFGLDCLLAPDGTVVVFEANATMNYNPVPTRESSAHMTAILPRTLDAVVGLLEAKARARSDLPVSIRVEKSI